MDMWKADRKDQVMELAGYLTPEIDSVKPEKTFGSITLDMSRI